jgi:hypothetical protein
VLGDALGFGEAVPHAGAGWVIIVVVTVVLRTTGDGVAGWLAGWLVGWLAGWLVG